MSKVESRWLRAGLLASALFILAACGGHGGGGSSGPGPSKVFAADEVNGGVGSSPNATPGPGTTFSVERIITGANTQLPVGPGCPGCIPGMALDSPHDQLYVSTRNGILVYNNAGTASGNIAPSRVIGIGSGQRHIQLDTASDVLYISSGATANGNIFALNSASTAGSSSTASRTLTLTMLSNDSIIGLALDATHDVLYVALSRNTNPSVGLILGVASKPSGAVTLDAEFAVSGSIGESISVDPVGDRLFVADFLGQVFVFDNASTRTSGAQTANRTIQMPFSTQFRLFLESVNDRLYASGQNRVVILNNAGTATSAVGAAVAQLSTVNSDLTAVVASP